MSNVYVPQDGGQYSFYPPPFHGNWNNTIGMGKKTGKGKKKKNSGKKIAVRKKQPVRRNSDSGRHFVNKALSNFDLEGWIDKLGIKHSRGIFSRDALPESINKKECGIINLDDIVGQGTHRVCYRNLEKNFVEYFDPFGLIMPYEIRDYLLTSGKNLLIYSQDEIQNGETVLCGYLCSYYLNERQKGHSILDVIHNEGFDEDNSDFIKDYFINKQY